MVRTAGGRMVDLALFQVVRCTDAHIVVSCSRILKPRGGREPVPLLLGRPLRLLTPTPGPSSGAVDRLIGRRG
jgi:hypothetical protein